MEPARRRPLLLVTSNHPDASRVKTKQFMAGLWIMIREKASF